MHVQIGSITYLLTHILISSLPTIIVGCHVYILCKTISSNMHTSLAVAEPLANVFLGLWRTIIICCLQTSELLLKGSVYFPFQILTVEARAEGSSMLRKQNDTYFHLFVQFLVFNKSNYKIFRSLITSSQKLGRFKLNLTTKIQDNSCTIKSRDIDLTVIAYYYEANLGNQSKP